MKKTVLICAAFLAFINLSLAQNYNYPIIDSHCHIKTHSDEPYITVEDYFDQNADFDVKYLFGLTVARKGDMQRTMASNDSLFRYAQENNRFIPVYSVHPHDGEQALRELERISGMEAKIIKLHPISQNFKIVDQRVLDVTRKAGEKNLTVLMDGYGFLRPDYLDNLLQLTLISPDTKFIIAHMGGSDFFKLGALSMVRRAEPGRFTNVWYDLSATVVIYAGSPYQEQLEWIIRQVGVDRVLFGTDHPVATLPEALEAFYKLNLTEEERQLILYKNAMSLLDLD